METLPCDTCVAPCCREYTVYLDGSDAYRIARTLKAPICDFVELQPHAEPDERWQIRLDDGPLRYRMHIKRVPDPDPRWAQRCMFLLSVGERGRCGIYSMRPTLCATYPTGMSDGLVNLGGGGQFCPPDSWQLESLDVPAFRLWNRKKQQGTIVYRAVVDGWNARVMAGPAPHPRLYYSYLFNVYDELASTAPALLGDDGREPAANAIESAVKHTLTQMGWS